MTSPRVEAILAPLEADLTRYWMAPELRAHILAVISLTRQLSTELEFSNQVIDDVRNTRLD